MRACRQAGLCHFAGLSAAALPSVSNAVGTHPVEPVEQFSLASLCPPDGTRRSGHIAGARSNMTCYPAAVWLPLHSFCAHVVKIQLSLPTKKKKKGGHKKFIQKLVRIHVALEITRELSRSPVNRRFSPLFVHKKRRSFASVSCFNLWFAVPSICLNGDNKGWVEHVSGGGRSRTCVRY